MGEDGAPGAQGGRRRRRAGSPRQSPPSHTAGSRLVVLLETHATAWPALAAQSARGGAGVAPASFVAQVGAFLGAVELEAEGNAVVVLGVHEGCW